MTPRTKTTLQFCPPWKKSSQPVKSYNSLVAKETLKNNENDQKWPWNDLKWPWDQKQLHHCVCHGKAIKNCLPFYPLTLITLVVFMKK